jgi:hypothetical protein
MLVSKYKQLNIKNKISLFQMEPYASVLCGDQYYVVMVSQLFPALMRY